MKKEIEQIPSVPTLSVFFGRGSESVKIVVLYSCTKRSVLGNRILNKKYLHLLIIILVFGYAIRQLKCEYLDSCLSDLEWSDY